MFCSSFFVITTTETGTVIVYAHLPRLVRPWSRCGPKLERTAARLEICQAIPMPAAERRQDRLSLEPADEAAAKDCPRGRGQLRTLSCSRQDARLVRRGHQRGHMGR